MLLRTACIILILLFQVQVICAQKDSSKKTWDVDVVALITETANIMWSLGIDVRDNCCHDGRMVFTSTDSIGFIKTFFGLFIGGGRVLNLDSTVNHYDAPTLYVSKDVDSILTERRDTSFFYEWYCRGIVVHELCHYLQKRYYPITLKQRIDLGKRYMDLPDESEAFQVQSYFFLTHYAPNLITSLNSSFDKKSDVFKKDLVKQVDKIYTDWLGY